MVYIQGNRLQKRVGAAELICQGKQKEWTWDRIEENLQRELTAAAISSKRCTVLQLIQAKASQQV